MNTLSTEPLQGYSRRSANVRRGEQGHTGHGVSFYARLRILAAALTFVGKRDSELEGPLKTSVCSSVSSLGACLSSLPTV